MKEMVLLPDGSRIYSVVSDYVLDESCNKYKAEIEHKGIKYVVHFYNNFWA